MLPVRGWFEAAATTAIIMLYSILGHEVSNITLLIEIDYLIERKNRLLDHFSRQKLNMHLAFVFVFNSCINENSKLPEILLVILIWSYFFKYSIEIFHKNIASLHRFTLCGLCNLKHQMKKLLQKKVR